MIQQQLVFPAPWIKVEIHHQLAKLEQTKRCVSMNLPVRLNLQHGFNDTLEVFFGCAVFGDPRKRDTKIDAKLFPQRKVGKNVFTGRMYAILKCRGLRIELAFFQVHWDQHQRRQAGAVFACDRFIPLQKTERKIKDVCPRFLKRRSRLRVQNL
ncbi:hypothetical protein D9M71_213530 [compost metagenome]